MLTVTIVVAALAWLFLALWLALSIGKAASDKPSKCEPDWLVTREVDTSSETAAYLARQPKTRLY